jgi:hypothetical protein
MTYKVKCIKTLYHGAKVLFTEGNIYEAAYGDIYQGFRTTNDLGHTHVWDGLDDFDDDGTGDHFKEHKDPRYDLVGKVIILNAPPNAGKDTIADALSEATGACHRRFKEHLIECTAVVFNICPGDLQELLDDRTTKEVPNPRLMANGKQYSPRGALIFTSENVIKPAMGPAYFGDIVADDIAGDTQGTVCSDGGFPKEIEPLLGCGNEVFIVQFTRGEYNSFEGDSRDWLDMPEVPTIRLENDGTVGQMVNKILDFVNGGVKDEE